MLGLKLLLLFLNKRARLIVMVVTTLSMLVYTINLVTGTVKEISSFKLCALIDCSGVVNTITTFQDYFNQTRNRQLDIEQTDRGKEKKSLKAEWQHIDNLLASTPQRRLRAARKLGIDKGKHVVAFISISCSQCITLTSAIACYADSHQILLITTANKEQVREWKEEHKLNLRVEAVSQEIFEDLGGPVILPTLALYKDGKAIGVAESVNVLEQ